MDHHAFNQTHIIPEDIRICFFETSWQIEDLPGVLPEDVQDWRNDLRLAFKAWNTGGPEPDWAQHRDRMDDILILAGHSPQFPW